MLINGARDLGGEPNIGAAQVLPQAFAPPVEAIQHILAAPGPPGYTDHQGWGMLNLTRLLDAAANHYWLDQSVLLAHGNAWSTPTAVTNGGVVTRITLVWTDPVGTAGQHYVATNNLDLLVCDNFAVTCYYANRFDSNGNSQPTPPNPVFSESKNVVEEVIIPSGTFATGSTLFVNVVAKNIMMGPTQDFAVFTSNTH